MLDTVQFHLHNNFIGQYHQVQSHPPHTAGTPRTNTEWHTTLTCGDGSAHQTGAETDALQKSTSSANFQNKQTITYKQTLNRFDV